MSKAFEPATQPTAVGVAGTIVQVPIHANYADSRIDRIVVVPLSGSATSTAVTVSSDSAVTTRRKQIAAFSGVTAAAPVDNDNGGVGYVWDRSDDANANVYVKIVPNAGSDNNYDVRVYVGRRP